MRIAKIFIIEKNDDTFNIKERIDKDCSENIIIIDTRKNDDKIFSDIGVEKSQENSYINILEGKTIGIYTILNIVNINDIIKNLINTIDVLIINPYKFVNNIKEKEFITRIFSKDENILGIFTDYQYLDNDYKKIKHQNSDRNNLYNFSETLIIKDRCMKKYNIAINDQIIQNIKKVGILYHLAEVVYEQRSN